MTTHDCVREQIGLSLIYSGFLASKYVQEFIINPDWSNLSFHKRVIQDLNIDFKHHVLMRAKRKCLRIINERDGEQFAKLWDYMT